VDTIFYADIPGINIRCKQTGNGPDILFVHGTPGPLEGWPPAQIIERLSGKFRLTMYDRPGHGQSIETPLVDYSIEQNAEIALELINKLQLSKPLVVGHSYGGTIALCMATKQPDNIRGFLAVSPMLYPTSAAPFAFKIVLLPHIGKMFIKFLIRFAGKLIIKGGLSTMFYPNMDCIPSDYVTTNASFMTEMTIGSFFKEMIFANDGLNKMRETYDRIDLPVTLVHGISDRVFDYKAQSQAFHNAHPNTNLILMENTGHMVQFARPQELVDIIQGMFK